MIWYKGFSAVIGRFFKWLKGLRFRDLILYSQRAVEEYGARYYEFAIFGLCFCIYPLLFLDTAYELYPKADQYPMWLIEMILRICAAFGCLTIGLQHMWQENSIRKYMPLYFHFMLMCALPALSVYAYLVSPHDDNMLAGMVLAISSVALFVDWWILTLILALGFILGNVTYTYFAYMAEHTPIYNGATGGLLLYVLLSIILSCLMRLIQEMYPDRRYYMATRDVLTGLQNRQYLDTHLERLIKDAHNRGKDLSIIAVDIDHFRKLNDKHGHDVGDAVLQELGKIMQYSARPLDINARLGGEEFLIVLPDTNIEKASAIAERLRSKVAGEPFKINLPPDNISCTISLGVTVLKPADTIESLLKRANKGLYDAKGKKTEGRNRVRIATE